MVSTSGSQLLPPDAVRIIRTKLIPAATILTPNIQEAMVLLRDSGTEVQDPEDLKDAIGLAKQLHTLGPKFVLLKGGHLPLTGDHVKPGNSRDACAIVDVLYDGTSVTLFETEFIMSRNTHGTGCSLASAIAANLASGMDVVRAVRAACRFVEAGIKSAVHLGKGNGPINHFHSIYSLPFAPYVSTPYGLLR
jgi:hydroxymethylpyrimidine kinase/phosphomethylpyrimidine kinase